MNRMDRIRIQGRDDGDLGIMDSEAALGYDGGVIPTGLLR